MDLFDFAHEPAPKACSGREAEWDEPVNTLWGRAWLGHVQTLFGARCASELAFGEKLLAAGRLQALRVRRGHIQAAFTNREGGTALVNLDVKPLAPERWVTIDRLCDDCGENLFCSDELPDHVVQALFELPDGLLPARSDFSFSCSHCHTPFCLYRAAALFAAAAEFDRAPIKLFELRGATRELIFMRAAQQTAGDPSENIDERDVSAIFGIELA